MDIQSYLGRIHYQGSLEPTLQTLRALHEAHLLAVPFENLDIHLGREIVLDEVRLWTKIIEQRRGGFCFIPYSLHSPASLIYTMGKQNSSSDRHSILRSTEQGKEIADGTKACNREYSVLW